MTKKTRKRSWPVPLLMALAVIGALTTVIALTASPGATQAHDEADHDAACAAMTDAERKEHNTLAGLVSGGAERCADPGDGGNGGDNGNGTSPTPAPTPVTGNGTSPTPAPTPVTGSRSDATELPDAVQNLSVVPYEEAEGGIPQEQLKISWDPPPADDPTTAADEGGGPVTGYRIDLSTDGGKEWFSYIGDHAGSDLRVIYGDENKPNQNETPLIALQNMHFRVFAFNKAGTGPGVVAEGATSASWRPDPATDLTANVVLAGPGGLDLNRDGDGPGRGPGRSDRDNPACQGDTNDMADTGPYATAAARIVERDSDTEDPERIDLRWTAPEDPPGAPVTGYKIEYSPDGTRWFVLEEMVGTDEAFRDISLIANETRYYRIYALNSVGPSLVSEDSAVETSGPSLTPVLPREIKHVVMSPYATDLRITWVTPCNPLGDPVARYEIQAKASASDNPYRSVVSGAFSDNFRIDEDRGTTTFVTSNQDLEAIGIPFEEDGSQMVDVRIRPGNRAGYSGDDTSAAGDEWLVISNIPWGHPNLPLKQRTPRVEQDTEQNQGRSGLDVYWYPAGFVAGQGPDEDDLDRTTFESQVRYVLEIGYTEETEAQSYRMEYDAITSRARTRAHVGADDARQMTNDDDLHTRDDRKHTVYPIRALADLSPSFRISGRDVSTNTLDVIRGFPSDAVKGTTNDPLRPGAPTDFFVNADGHTEIRLRWSPPVENPDRLCQNTAEDAVGNNRRLGDAATADPELEDDGSECGASVITGYRVYMSDDGTTDWNLVTEVAGTEHLETGLTPDHRYYFRVSAVNASGEGNPTRHESAVTEQTDVPTPPGGLVAQAVSSSQLKICWYSHNRLDPQSGDALDEDLPVLGYRITYVDADDNEVILESNTMSKDTVYEDRSELEPDTKRTYRVRGINLANLHLVDGDDVTLGGTPYTEASATTDEGPVIPPDLSLKAPTDVVAMADGNTVTVTWTDGANADRHVVFVFETSDPANPQIDGSRISNQETDGTVTFTVPAGKYTALVVAVEDDASGSAMNSIIVAAPEVTVN